MWANMYAAYDALSGSMQSFLSGMTAIHDFMMAFGPSVSRLQKNPEALVRKQQENPPAEHPVIRTHPETGKKGIYVNSAFTSHIVGMKKEESKAILNFLYQHVATPEFSCRFKWTQNTVAFWDNRCTQHYAHADYFPHERNMHRIALKGEKPS
jgi:taurine dioxygenase